MQCGPRSNRKRISPLNRWAHGTRKEGRKPRNHSRAIYIIIQNGSGKKTCVCVASFYWLSCQQRKETFFSNPLFYNCPSYTIDRSIIIRQWFEIPQGTYTSDSTYKPTQVRPSRALSLSNASKYQVLGNILITQEGMSRKKSNELCVVVIYYS